MNSSISSSLLYAVAWPICSRRPPAQWRRSTDPGYQWRSRRKMLGSSLKAAHGDDSGGAFGWETQVHSGRREIRCVQELDDSHSSVLSCRGRRLGWVHEVMQRSGATRRGRPTTSRGFWWPGSSRPAVRLRRARSSRIGTSEKTLNGFHRHSPGEHEVLRLLRRGTRTVDLEPNS